MITLLDFSVLGGWLSNFGKGMWMTIQLSLICVFFGILLGIIINLGKSCKFKPLSIICAAYIEIIRGTPTLLQLSLFAFAIPFTFKLNWSLYVASVITLSLNSSAYVSEIFRAGLESVDKGQIEAAKCLGLSDFVVFYKIKVPQALKSVLPALGNEFVTVVKETAIVATIGIQDLKYWADKVGSSTFSYFEPLIFSALLYFTITFTISKLMQLLERKLKQSERKID